MVFIVGAIAVISKVITIEKVINIITLPISLWSVHMLFPIMPIAYT